MKSSERLEFQVELENEQRDGHTTVTVSVEIDEHGRVQARAVGEAGRKGRAEDYQVSFIIRGKQGGDHCWVCLNEPCPPNRLSWVSPCPSQP